MVGLGFWPLFPQGELEIRRHFPHGWFPLSGEKTRLLGYSPGPRSAIGRDHPVVGAPVFVHESGAMVSGLVWYTGFGNATIVQALESVTQSE